MYRDSVRGAFWKRKIIVENPITLIIRNSKASSWDNERIETDK